MAFTGGPINTVGIVPSYTSNLGQQTSASGVVQAQNQVWQGFGQAFVGQPGQPLTGELTGSPINIALNSDSVQNVFGPNGASLGAGNNILAPAMTQFIGGGQSFGFDNQIGSSLNNAGPFGSLMSRGGNGGIANLASTALGAAGGAIGGVAGALIGAANYIMFPGAGGEGGSNFAGIPYTLQDVTFSLQPANRGPQSFGMEQSTSFPKSMTTLPFNEYTSMPQLAGSPTSNALKSSSMVGGLSSRAFTPGTASSSNFNTSLNLF
jgi:hypothetical protein